MSKTPVVVPRLKPPPGGRKTHVSVTPVPVTGTFTESFGSGRLKFREALPLRYTNLRGTLSLGRRRVPLVGRILILVLL